MGTILVELCRFTARVMEHILSVQTRDGSPRPRRESAGEAGGKDTGRDRSGDV